MKAIHHRSRFEDRDRYRNQVRMRKLVLPPALRPFVSRFTIRHIQGRMRRIWTYPVYQIQKKATVFASSSFWGLVDLHENTLGGIVLNLHFSALDEELAPAIGPDYARHNHMLPHDLLWLVQERLPDGSRKTHGFATGHPFLFLVGPDLVEVVLLHPSLGNLVNMPPAGNMSPEERWRYWPLLHFLHFLRFLRFPHTRLMLG